MRSVAGRLTVLTLLVLHGACASSGQTRKSPRTDRSVIVQDELLAHHFVSAFEAVQALRSNWLQPKGTDSFVSPTPIWVYLDDNRLGGIETLRSINIFTVVSIRRYDGLSATARWGLGHGQGVIFVASRS